MKRVDVKQIVIDILVDLFMCDSSLIRETTVASDIDGWDSLSHSILLLEISSKFNIEVDEKISFTNVGELIDYLCQILGCVEPVTKKNVKHDEFKKAMIKIKELNTLNQYADVERVILSILDVYPQNLKLNRAYFKVLLKLKKLSQAGKVAMANFALEPESIINLRNCALYYRRMNLFSEALLYLERALIIRPDYIPTLIDKAEILVKADLLEQAIHVVNQIVKLDAANYKAFQIASNIRVKLGDSKYSSESIFKDIDLHLENKVIKSADHKSSFLGYDRYNWHDLNELNPNYGKFMVENPVHPELPYCFFMNDKSENTSRIFVNFCGAINQKARQIPTFARWNWHGILPGKILSVFDSTLFLDKKISLGWYLGVPDMNIMSGIVDIIKKIADNSGVAYENIIMHGSSGGGFSAMRAASLLKGATALVFNPQVNIISYHGSHNDKLHRVYGDAISDLFDSSNFDVTSTIVNGEVAKLIYVQNVQDKFHYNTYFKPLKLALNDSNYLDRVEFIEYDHEYGHAPIPLNIYENVIKKKFS
ncbi:MAG: hypothetical protein PHC75_07075 [Burkholderiales bacterium]|nr:hypothetical protein [Burkholderiales bacterium]